MELLPLGSLAPERAGNAWSVESLDRSSVMEDDLRARVAKYLAACPVFLAWMEYTRDLIGDRFGVSGGSAIVSDGVYYWRLDAAEYVREYGIAVPEAALRHFEAVGWQPPVFSQEQYLAIYRCLDALLG
ncbi:hypothetical protein [Kribbella sp. NPDC049584]|uniref:hypothetical protein n=1 Tax=Kribbella sp. NPDC049584 TaxID=3154833 RepID=UPI003442E786